MLMFFVPEFIQFPYDYYETFIYQGISNERILDDIRESLSADALQRVHLTSQQDLQNLKRSFNLENIQRNENDQDSVLSWINQWQSDEHNPIKYYKLQGEKDDKKKLGVDDFIIVIQTESQKYLLQCFGDKGVCCDSTHGTTGYDFGLSSLLIVDEFGEGVPVAWCLSNHEDYKFMKIFFQVR